MNLQTADRHRRTELVCVLILAGVFSLAGCAVPMTAGKVSGAARPARSPVVTTDPVVPALRGDLPSLDISIAEVAPYGEPSPVVQDSPVPQPSPSPVRLVSDTTPAGRGQAGASECSSSSAEIARLAARPAGLPERRGVLHAGTADFEDQVLRSDVPVLVDFYATWCGPCKALAPTLEEVASESPQAKVLKVDIDENPELAARYGVKSIPSVMLFKDGQVVARQNGVVGKHRLKTMLDL